MTNRPVDARTAILDAAEELFAVNGFAATTIKMIGAGSSQNSALIYYYYDSKATLYRHVLARIANDLASEATRRTVSAHDPESVVRSVVASQVALFSARPHLPALIARELTDFRAANVESAFRMLASTVFARLRAAIESGQRDGLFRSEPNPLYAAISVIAQVAFLMLARPATGILLGRDRSGPTVDDLRSFGEHAAEFALAALRDPSFAAPPAPQLREELHA